MLKLIEEYCAIPAVSGDEAALRACILDKVRPYAEEIKTDRLGNLLVFCRGKRRAKVKLMLDAHMDEIGLVITGAAQNGCLHFAKAGGIDDRVLFGRHVRIGSVPGVIGGCAVHQLEKAEREKPVPADKLLIDIGAQTAEEALALVSVGDTAVFDAPFLDLGSRIAARALDDRVGCALLTRLIQSGPDYDMWFTFTVQEEVGCRGGRVAAFSLAPDAAIVVESTTAADLAGVPAERQVCTLGRGPAISFMDTGAVYDRGLYELAMQIGRREQIAVQPKAAVAGGNNAGAIHLAGAGVRTCAVSLPCRYIHSATGVVDKGDIEAAYDLLRALSAEIAAGHAL